MSDCNCGGSLFSHDPDCATKISQIRSYVQSGWKPDPAYITAVNEAAGEITVRPYPDPDGQPPTRVDVVLPGKVHEFWADKWDIHAQDDGRTVKLIATGTGKEARAERDEALGEDMVRDRASAEYKKTLKRISTPEEWAVFEKRFEAAEKELGQ